MEISPAKFLLGLNKDHSAICTFINSLDNDLSCQEKVYGEVTYCNYYSLGLSFVYKNNILDSLDIYGIKINSIFTSFSKCPEKVLRKLLPSILPEATGKDIINQFGEPERKGGGKQIEIWTEWTSKGIMVQFDTKDWEKGGDTRWSVITIFQLMR